MSNEVKNGECYVRSMKKRRKEIFKTSINRQYPVHDSFYVNFSLAVIYL